MKRIVTLYHGSKEIVKSPRFGYDNPNNDYGLGFYCTEDLEIAKEWGVTSENDGYINKYLLDAKGLTVLDLSSSECNVLHWITILLQNRVFTLKNNIAKAGRQYLFENFSLPYQDCDIIKGYRADDSYFSFAESFLNNSISVQRLSEALRLGELGEQIVLKSKKAFKRLQFIGCENVSSEDYYPLRKARNDKARFAFLSDKEGPFDPNSLYLTDIMRKEVSPDDPRLR